MIKALSQAQISELAESGRKSLEKERGASDQAPTLRNVGLAVNLDGDDTLEWRGCSYRVPPVPWDLGVELLEIQTDLMAQTKDAATSLADFRGVLQRATQLFPRLIRRRFSRWRPNPFRRASGREVGMLLGFFSACQMKPPVDVRSAISEGHRPRSTSRTG